MFHVKHGKENEMKPTYHRCESCVNYREKRTDDGSCSIVTRYCNLDGIKTKVLIDKQTCDAYEPEFKEVQPQRILNNVNHPSHYAGSCSIECIDVMKLIFGEENVSIFCMINSFKYLWRWEHKNGIEDLNKALWYLNEAAKQNNAINCSDTYNSLRNMTTREIEKYETKKNDEQRSDT